MIKIYDILENYGVCSCTCHFFFVSLCTFCARNMKLSIITINRNNAAGLRKTMESVFSQTYREFEYIVVDGASADESVEVINELTSERVNELKNFTWISEPDTGIYNAMNKGIEIAEGRRVVNSFNQSERSVCEGKGNEDGYVLMLNSGDYLVDEHVVERIMPELHTEEIIQGNVIEDYPDKTIRFRGYGKSDISFIDVMDDNFPHQAMFIRLETMNKYGYYDDSYKKGADTYFFITALGLGNATYRYVDIDITNFDVNGISAMRDPKWIKIDQEEDTRWYGDHVSKRLMDFYQMAPKKMLLYDRLHKNNFIWKLTIGLVRVSEWLNPSKPNVKKEKLL